MARQPCDGCGTRVRIAGGIANIWSFQQETTGGLDLELADGSDFFLCFDCIEKLPDDHDPGREDVEAIREAEGVGE